MPVLPIGSRTPISVNRRICLASLAGGITLGAISPLSAAQKGPIRLVPRSDANLFRVVMEIGVQGNVKIARTATSADSNEQLLPITGTIKLDYEERFLRPAGVDPKAGILAAERHYHTARGSSTVSRREQAIELRPEAAFSIARRDELPETIYSPTTWLNHDELDLLRTPLSSVSVDELIPREELTPGQPLRISNDVLTSAFNLSAVDAGEVELELMDNDANTAKLQLRGRIDGSVSGVPTVLRIVGKLTFDHKSQMVTWAAVAIHETREIGKAEPGFDVTATIRMVRQPLAKPIALPAKASVVDLEQPPAKERMLLAVKSEHAGAAMLLDRRWRLISDAPGGAVLRMVDTERTIAQCNLRPLPQLESGKQLTLEGFEADCRKTLGSQLGGVLQAQERLSDAGVRVLQVAASGEVQGVPIQWLMLHFSDDNGHRVQATLTMDVDNVPKLDGSDVQMIETLRLSDPQIGVAATEKQKKESDGSVSQLKSSNSKSESVKSPSDAAAKKPAIATGPAKTSQK